MFLRFARWVPADGILFAILVVIASLIRDQPGRDAPNSEVLAYYADSGNRAKELLAAFLIGLAVLCFLSFLGSLRGALARSEGEPARLSTVVAASGATFIALAAAAHVAGSSVAHAAEIFDDFQVDADLARLFMALDYGFFVMSLFAAAAMALSASVLALHTGVFPRWLAGLGLAAALAGVLGFLLFPSLVVLAWIVAVSAYLLVRAAPADRGPVTDAV
jgi:hypothetical protein